MPPRQNIIPLARYLTEGSHAEETTCSGQNAYLSMSSDLTCIPEVLVTLELTEQAMTGLAEKRSTYRADVAVLVEGLCRFLDPVPAQLGVGVHRQDEVFVINRRQDEAECLVQRAGLPASIPQRPHDLRAILSGYGVGVVSTVIAYHHHLLGEPCLVAQRSEGVADRRRFVMRRGDHDDAPGTWDATGDGLLWPANSRHSKVRRHRPLQRTQGHQNTECIAVQGIKTC